MRQRHIYTCELVMPIDLFVRIRGRYIGIFFRPLRKPVRHGPPFAKRRVGSARRTHRRFVIRQKRGAL